LFPKDSNNQIKNELKGELLFIFLIFTALFLDSIVFQENLKKTSFDRAKMLLDWHAGCGPNSLFGNFR